MKRILEKLKKVKPARLSEVHQHLIVPLAGLSRLASIPYLKQIFKDTAINRWMLPAFKEAVSKGDQGGESVWLFASCLIQLATDVDAFNLSDDQVEKPSRNGDGRGQTPNTPLRVDSKSLLAYLLNKETPATSEQVEYALKIILANVEEHPALASDPRFVNYIVYATGPGPVYSVRDIGLKVLVAACQSLLLVDDADKLLTLAANCDLAHFLHRAMVHQDPPAILKNLLRINDEDCNKTLLGILAPALGAPFDNLKTRLLDEPNKILDRNLRDLEISLVLSNNEGRKELLFNHLDRRITMMPRDYRDTMTLLFTVIVGWLLRRDGPVSASQSLGKELLRPNFEMLLFSAWIDLNALKVNPQLLRPLVDCTTRWLSTHPETATSSELPSDVTLTRLQKAVDQVRSGNWALSLDIQRGLQKLSEEIGDTVRSRSPDTQQAARDVHHDTRVR